MICVDVVSHPSSFCFVFQAVPINPKVSSSYYVWEDFLSLSLLFSPWSLTAAELSPSVSCFLLRVFAIESEAASAFQDAVYEIRCQGGVLCFLGMILSSVLERVSV